jgi:2-polyprenyl-6-methoxyphenol hydroxylase-like FAD-dependent oxidoreductase
MVGVERYDVIVVGAGPVGLTLAIDLGRRGIRCLLIERNLTTAPWPKMDRSNSRTMELYRRIGIADRVRSLGYPANASMDVLIVTRLCDPPLAILPYPSVDKARAQIAACRDGSLPLEPCQLVSQNDLEPLLKEVAQSTPNVAIRYGSELLDICQNGAGVNARVRQRDGSERVLQSDYLVGCDGGQSIVRDQLGIKLEGQGRFRRSCQVIFRSDDLFAKIPIGKGRHYIFAHHGVETLVVQGSRTEFTLHTGLPPGTDFEAIIREVIGFSCQIDIRHVLPWHHDLLVAEHYRDRRIFLAGDAVHVVVPAGELGMNTGVGDAFDLSWKLAGTINGWGGPRLLDSYERERRPVGLRIRDASGWAAASAETWRRLVTPNVRDDTAEGAAVRAAIAVSATVNHRRMYDMRGIELGYSYGGSPLIAEEPGNVAEWDTIIYTPDTRPGVRIPHMWLKNGAALHDVLGHDFTLLDLEGNAETQLLENAFRKLGIPLRIVRLDEPEIRTVYGFKVFLLRPDLHIAWRGDTAPPDPVGLAMRVTGAQEFTHPAIYPIDSSDSVENDQCYAVALYELGRAYEFGRRGVSRNKAKAIYWYQEAAKRGNLEAQYWLGRKYERGQDLPKNIDKALFWLRRAAGHEQKDMVQASAERELARLERQPPQ